TTAGAGVSVNVTRAGEHRDIPAGIDQSAFRIVQEALTNVVKHSGATSCWVSVGYERTGLRVESPDHGRGPAAGADRSRGGGPERRDPGGAGRTAPATGSSACASG